MAYRACCDNLCINWVLPSPQGEKLNYFLNRFDQDRKEILERFTSSLENVYSLCSLIILATSFQIIMINFEPKPFACSIGLSFKSVFQKTVSQEIKFCPWPLASWEFSCICSWQHTSHFGFSEDSEFQAWCRILFVRC